MGKQFGNLMKTRHVVSYYLSPFEQKIFPSIPDKILNTWRRFSSSFFRVTPPGSRCRRLRRAWTQMRGQDHQGVDCCLQRLWGLAAAMRRFPRGLCQVCMHAGLLAGKSS
uniref:Cytochrome b-c1 complex subunit 8 n=1 Tax=Naja naja TaxID=35670 RepID=A0A8C6VNA3_NAJNA